MEIHGKSTRVTFMYKSIRHRYPPGIEPTRNNIKHAAGLRSAALHTLKAGNYNEADFFPHSRAAEDLEVWLNRLESRTDLVRVLLSPRTQARKEAVNDYFMPSAWNTKWGNLARRAGILPRQPNLTRHTYACWNLTARDNFAFIANQVGFRDYSMLVNVYGRWIDTESPKELERIRDGMQSMAKNAPNLPQTVAE